MRRGVWLTGAVVVVALGGCATSASLQPAAARSHATSGPGAVPPATRSPMPPMALPRSKATPKLQPTATLRPVPPAVETGGAKPPANPPPDSVPLSGSGTFAVSPGGTGVVGAGTTLVTYETRVEKGITWGANPVWTPAGFATAVDAIIANPRGWTASAAAPVTDKAQGFTNASWRFQRVSGSSFGVRILLATPNTTDKLCGSVGLITQGQYSCRYGNTMVINLRRWLKGAPGFAMDLGGYHNMVINHEMGHRLGFDHMLCPGPGRLAPVMQEETINLAGCKPNPYPFAADGTFIDGPWAAS